MLNSQQVKYCSKFIPMISVRSGPEYWVTNGVVLYRYDSSDVFEKAFDKSYNIAPQDTIKWFGTINYEDEIEESGMTIDVKIEGVKKTVSMMTRKSDNNIYLFLVDNDLLAKVRPRKAGDKYLIGIRNEKKILYNNDRTIGVVCVKDSAIPELMCRYNDLFTALDAMRILNMANVAKEE